MAYYRKRYGWSINTQEWINWDEYGRARKRNETKKHYITGLCSCWLPSNYLMNMTEGIDPACRLCGETETTDHMFACPGRKKWRHNLYKTLCKCMARHQTAPAIIKAVLHGLRWHYEADYQPQTQIEDEHQHDIGWNHLFRGWIDRSWQT